MAALTWILCQLAGHFGVERQLCCSHPVWKLLICHESFQTGLTLPIASPNPLPGCICLIAIFVTDKPRKDIVNTFRSTENRCPWWHVWQNDNVIFLIRLLTFYSSDQNTRCKSAPRRTNGTTEKCSRFWRTWKKDGEQSETCQQVLNTLNVMSYFLSIVFQQVASLIRDTCTSTDQCRAEPSHYLM